MDTCKGEICTKFNYQILILCPGDGGAPLVCQQSQGSWYQAGIVSFGIGCAEKDVPAVYADVAYAACWIDQEVACYISQT